MSEHARQDFLFSPLEKSLADVVEKKPTKLDELALRSEKALQKLFRIHENSRKERQEILSAIDKLNSDPEKKNASRTFKSSIELPKGIIDDVGKDFKRAFPKYAEKFDDTKIQYLLGYSKLTNNDKTNFLELLGEEGTLMGEAYPFYEILTQKLSEKVASSHKGLWGKVFGMMAKITGKISYYQDRPVLREWNNVESHLATVYGKERASELIEDMYFGEKNEYQVFLKSCEMAKLDFLKLVERANHHSRFINILKKTVINNPKILNNPAIVGGLNLPGKIHDMWVMSSIGTALAMGGLGGLFASTGGGMVGYQMVAGIGAVTAGIAIGAGGIGVLFHEMTHAYGGNFRRKLKEINEKKIS